MSNYYSSAKYLSGKLSYQGNELRRRMVLASRNLVRARKRERLAREHCIRAEIRGISRQKEFERRFPGFVKNPQPTLRRLRRKMLEAQIDLMKREDEWKTLLQVMQINNRKRKKK